MDKDGYHGYDSKKYVSEALQKVRNDTLEEVAVEFERFTFAIGVDTVASFAAFVRGMKE